jgi:hypothetical protein
MMKLNQPLRALPSLAPPRELADRLLVLASKEALRRRRRVSFRSWLAYCQESVALFFDNLMRPYAVPFAGGLFSAIVIFAVLGPYLHTNRQVSSDEPTPLFTEASLESSFSFNMTGEDVIVDLQIDGQGRVVGYSIPRGQGWASNPALLRNLENTLLLTKFTPATFFGQPALGKTRITLRRSHLDVRG